MAVVGAVALAVAKVTTKAAAATLALGLAPAAPAEELVALGQARLTAKS